MANITKMRPKNRYVIRLQLNFLKTFELISAYIWFVLKFCIPQPPVNNIKTEFSKPTVNLCHHVNTQKNQYVSHITVCDYNIFVHTKCTAYINFVSKKLL